MNPLVLVADGEVLMHHFYRDHLALCGLSVETAAGGLECLFKVRHTNPRAIILDLDLPWDHEPRGSFGNQKP